jgi:hypothetical protein
VTATTFSTAGTADLLAIYSSKNNNKKHKANDNKKISSPATGNNNAVVVGTLQPLDWCHPSMTAPDLVSLGA